MVQVIAGQFASQAIRALLPAQQAIALLTIVVERVTASKPLSMMAQQRLFAQESVSFLLGMPETPALKTWYAALATLEKNREQILQELFDHQRLTEVEYDGTRYVLCHNPQREQQDRETRRRLVALTQSKLDSLRTNVQAERLKKKELIARRLHRRINRWGMERFFEVTYEQGAFDYTLREDEIERYTRLDGCYVIRSDVEREKQSTEELRDRYKDLKYVEQTFRTMKTTDIQTRPIRHFNELQVRGHIFACFLAYRVIWELRQRLAPVLQRDPDNNCCEAGSLAEVWRELVSITVARIKVNGKTITKLSQINAYAKKLVKRCQVPSLDSILSE